MQNYVKPTLRENLDQIIVNVEINNLASNKRPEQNCRVDYWRGFYFKVSTCDGITVRNNTTRK